MPKYDLKFKKKGERGFWHMSITATEKEEAIKEVEDFIWKRGDILEAHIEEIIHTSRKVWSHKED